MLLTGKGERTTGTFVVILIIAALAGGVVWNKRNANAAMAGIDFHDAHDATAVSGALRTAYCGSTLAAVTSMVRGVKVSSVGPTDSRVESRLGDVDEIVIVPQAGGSLVKARTLELYVGSHPKTHVKAGLMGVAAVMTTGSTACSALPPARPA